MALLKPSLLIAATPLLLGLSGCVAAIPLAAQLATGATSTAQLCAAAKIPGQTASLCDRVPVALTTQAQNGAASRSTVR